MIANDNSLIYDQRGIKVDLFKNSKVSETKKKRFNSMELTRKDFLDNIMREDYEDCGLNSDGSEVSNFEELQASKGKDDEDILEKQSQIKLKRYTEKMAKLQEYRRRKNAEAEKACHSCHDDGEKEKTVIGLVGKCPILKKKNKRLILE